jgi:hypothetical protein
MNRRKLAANLLAVGPLAASLLIIAAAAAASSPNFTPYLIPISGSASANGSVQLEIRDIAGNAVLGSATFDMLAGTTAGALAGALDQDWESYAYGVDPRRQIGTARLFVESDVRVRVRTYVGANEGPLTELTGSGASALGFTFGPTSDYIAPCRTGD